MKYNEEMLMDAVLAAVLGKDPHNPHGHAELQSALANTAIQQLAYGILRDDSSLQAAALINLKNAFQFAIETRKDDPAFYPKREDEGYDNE